MFENPILDLPALAAFVGESTGICKAGARQTIKEITLLWCTNHRQVKTSLGIGQSAWEGQHFLLCFTISHLMCSTNTKENAMRVEKEQHVPSHQRLNVGHPDGFANWLAG
jgi:hypothetical protein